MSDNQLIDMIENILLTPSSDFYIANILHDPTGAALDPRTIDSVDLGTIKVESIPMAIVLRGLQAHGLSNVQVAFDGQGNPAITVAGDTVTFHAVLPNNQPGYTRPPDVPAQATATGAIDVTIGTTVMPPGTITLTIKAIRDLTGVFDATEGAGGLATVDVTFTGLALDIDLAGQQMVIAVQLDTVFNPTINQVLNQPDIQATILAQVNAKLSSPDVLSNLSAVATTQARKALATN